MVFDRITCGCQLTDEPLEFLVLCATYGRRARLFEPFFSSTVRVLELGKKRNASLKFVSDPSPPERADAVARMQENSMILQWVQQCLERRISLYRWVLERLVIRRRITWRRMPTG